MKYVLLLVSLLVLVTCIEDITDLNATPAFEISYKCPKIKPTHCPKSRRLVCGYYDPTKIQCFRAPCAGTYSHPCEACKDTNVISFTCGKCPMYPSNADVITKYIKNNNWPQCF